MRQKPRPALAEGAEKAHRNGMQQYGMSCQFCSSAHITSAQAHDPQALFAAVIR
jgi:hypothetical protein